MYYIIFSYFFMGGMALGKEQELTFLGWLLLIFAPLSFPLLLGWIVKTATDDEAENK